MSDSQNFSYLIILEALLYSEVWQLKMEADLIVKSTVRYFLLFCSLKELWCLNVLWLVLIVSYLLFCIRAWSHFLTRTHPAYVLFFLFHHWFDWFIDWIQRLTEVLKVNVVTQTASQPMKEGVKQLNGRASGGGEPCSNLLHNTGDVRSIRTISAPSFI